MLRLSTALSLRKGLQEDILEPDLAAGNVDDREILRRLKVKLGVWEMASQVVTPESYWKNELIIAMGKPCWSAFACKMKKLKTPLQVESDTAMRSSTNSWAEEVHDLLVNGFFNVQDLYVVQNDKGPAHLKQHFSFLMTLLEKRTQSLASYFLLPPFRWAGVLHPQSKASTLAQMRQEAECLLRAEAQAASGQSMKPLQKIQWRKNNANRLLLLASEQDNLKGYRDTEELLKCCTTHMGDSRIVENVHQEAKASWQQCFLFLNSHKLSQAFALSFSNVASLMTDSLRIPSERLAISGNPASGKCTV